MLAKPRRLQKKKDFTKVLKTGKARSSRFLAIRLAGNDLQTNRLGLLVVARLFRKSSLRNKIKRRLRESAREIIPGIVAGKDIILIARPGLENKSVFEIKQIILSLIGHSEFNRS